MWGIDGKRNKEGKVVWDLKVLKLEAFRSGI